MSNNIVLCFDGTNNEYGAVNTNVVKLYAMLDKNADDQFSYYQPGIGTIPPPGILSRLKKWLVTRLDLAFAFLLEDHVCAGYRFLMRYYCPGDRIFIFGFSRGAYSARVLAAMLHKVGLLSKGNEELVAFAWGMLKRSVSDPVPWKFKSTFSRDVPIHFLGVWDTVSSVGWAYNPTYFQYTANNPSVHIVRHAVALDERRAYFRSNRWTSNPPQGQDVLELWFPGVHCDVGGGYPEAESGLSKIALQWMLDQAKQAGLRVDAAMETRLIPAADSAEAAAPNAAATQHESLKGLWWIVELLPHLYRDPSRNFAQRLIIPLGRRRTVPQGARIDASVYKREKLIPGYSPDNIPAEKGTA